MEKTVIMKAVVIGIAAMFFGIVVCPIIQEKSFVTAGTVVQQNTSFQNLTFNLSVARVMRLGHINSLSACVIKENKTVWSGWFGHCNMDQNKTPAPNTYYLLASISKTITATAILQLYEQGLFALDDDVNAKLDFRLVNPYHPHVPITYRMLLNHTSSLDVEPASFYKVRYLTDPPSLSSWLHDYFYPNNIMNEGTWRWYRPGTQFLYSNLGFCVLARLVELWSNQSFPDYCLQHIFNPLAMNNTSFLLSNIPADRIAVPYILAYHEPDLYLPLPPYTIFSYPAGGLRTTLGDLSHFLIAHMNGGVYNGTRILNQSTIQEMHAPSSYQRKDNLWYGLGWEIWLDTNGNTESMGHEGDIYGFTTSMKYRTADKTGIIYFTTRDPSTDTVKELKNWIAYGLLDFLLSEKASHMK